MNVRETGSGCWLVVAGRFTVRATATPVGRALQFAVNERSGRGSAMTTASKDKLGRKSPRSVFLEGCRVLAERFAALGFQPRRQGQMLVRSIGPWSHEIAIASSHYNQAGVSVAVSPTVVVRNKDLASWRAQHELWRTDDLVASRMLYRFAGSWTTWNLADPATRSHVLEEVTALLEQTALPWLDLFGDRLAFLERWQFDDEVLELDAMAELLAYFGRAEEIAPLVREALSREPWSKFSPRADSFDKLRRLGEKLSLGLSLPSLPEQPRISVPNWFGR